MCVWNTGTYFALIAVQLLTETIADSWKLGPHKTAKIAQIFAYAQNKPSYIRLFCAFL